MPVFPQKYLPYIILALCGVPLFFINIHDGHPLGDDFAQYIKEAMNIAHGKPFYQSNYIFNKYNTTYAPAQYPPGFPLLLAPVVKIFGLSFRAMFYYNSFIAACLLFALYAYFSKQTGMVAAMCLAILITYNGYMLDLKQNVLSDVPCLLFVTLYLFARNAEKFTWKRIGVLTLLVVAATTIRTQAIVLLGAEATWLLLAFIKTTVSDKHLSLKQLRTLPSFYIITCSIILIFFINKVIFYSPVSTASFYGHFIDVTLQLPWRDILEKQSGFLLNNIFDFFYYSANDDFLKTCIFFIQSSAVVFIVTGFMITTRKRLVVDDIFFVLMCLLVIYLPVHDERYFLNTMPLLFYYFYISLRHIIPAITSVDRRIVALVLSLTYLRAGYSALKKATDDNSKNYYPQPRDKMALDYISTHVNDSDIIVFVKPRLLTLFTNKKSMNVAWEIPQELNKRIFDSMHVKYMLVIDGLDDGYYHSYLREVQRPVDSVRIAGTYVLYSLR